MLLEWAVSILVYILVIIYIAQDQYIIYNLFFIFVFLVDTLGMEAMEEVERILAKMCDDADRDVRVLAGGEARLDEMTYSSDEDNQVEHAKYLLF